MRFFRKPVVEGVAPLDVTLAVGYSFHQGQRRTRRSEVSQEKLREVFT
tara:strand:- start:94 stop:237 length:144 start_codon:yes stop_codon:yes gene_type:complete